VSAVSGSIVLAALIASKEVDLYPNACVVQINKSDLTDAITARRPEFFWKMDYSRGEEDAD